MTKLATTKMSSKGQIVIPEDIRNRLHLKPGDKFMVIGEDDIVVLKTIHTPDISDFDDLINSARLNAAREGLSENDIQQAVVKARSTTK